MKVYREVADILCSETIIAIAIAIIITHHPICLPYS